MTIRRVLFLLLAMALASTAFGQVFITSTSPLPQGLSTIPYTYTFTAAEAALQEYPMTWSLAPGSAASLPVGYSLSPNGTFSGNTNQFGTFSFQVTVTAGPFSATGTFTLVLVNPFVTFNAPLILPNAFVGQSYSYLIQASSNPAGLIWSLGGGQLPQGLTLNSSGILSGTPTTAGVYQFVVSIQIANTNISTSQTFTLDVYAGQATITTTSLPLAVRGQAYSTTLMGNPTGVTWALTGMLPLGITFNANTGLLAGETIAVGAYPLQFQASFSNYVSSTSNLTLYVTSGPLAITAATLPTAVQGSPYQSTFAFTGGLGPYQWSLSGVGVQGLSLDPQAGTLSGTPTAAGTYVLTVTLSDATGVSVTRPFNLIVTPPLSVVTTTLPNGTVGTAYSQTLTAGGSQSPFTWTLAQGSLPLGLSLSSAGSVSGTPTSPGTFRFTVQVADTGGHTATGTITVSIGVMPLTITSSSPLPPGQLSVAYSQTLAASGGVAPYTWSFVSGTLPAGLRFNSNGTISGTPTGPIGGNTFTVQVTDSSPGTVLTAQKTFTLNIGLTLTITTLSLPGGTVSQPYSQTLAASGGTMPYTWSIPSGTLPPGLQLNAATGVISGTPVTTGPNLFVVTLTDALGLATSQQYNITVTALTVTSANAFSTVAGNAFSQTLTAAGGTPPYTWLIASGSLPAGLQLSSGGVISGTPTAGGTSNVTIKVTDSQQLTATQAITISVSFPPTPAVNIGTISGTAATQPSPSLTLGTAFPTTVTGTLSVSFQSAVGGNPTEVQFITSSGGSSSASFSIAAGSTNAVFSGAPVLATGTVAGTITLTATLSSGGVNITPSPAPTETIVIAPAAPVIQSVTFSNTGGSLTVTVTGYSTTREMVSGLFTFTPSSGSTLAQGSVTVQLGSAFSTWYQSSASNQYGGQFLLTMPFAVTGTAADVASVSVALTNTKGVSPAVSQ